MISRIEWLIFGPSVDIVPRFVMTTLCAYQAEESVFNDQSRELVLVPGYNIDRDCTSNGLAVGNQFCVSDDWMLLDVVQCGLESIDIVNNRRQLERIGSYPTLHSEAQAVFLSLTIKRTPRYLCINPKAFLRRTSFTQTISITTREKETCKKEAVN